MKPKKIIEFRLIPTTKRLTFDVIYQDPSTIYMGEDDGPYTRFVACNGYEVFSRSRMDIQTERLWVLGAKHQTEEGARSGSMVFSNNEKRDVAYYNFLQALTEWAEYHGGAAYQNTDFF